VIGPSLFFALAGLAHIRQIIIAHNYAPGNAGLFLYMDFVIPIVGCVLLWLQHRSGGIFIKLRALRPCGSQTVNPFNVATASSEANPLVEAPDFSPGERVFKPAEMLRRMTEGFTGCGKSRGPLEKQPPGLKPRILLPSV
jgi:hypothetical protein